jgi:hypothetical protein
MKHDWANGSKRYSQYLGAKTGWGMILAVFLIGATPSIPMVLDAIGAHGESAYDMVKAGDWRKAQADLDSLHTAAASLRTLGGAASEELDALDETLHALQHAVKSKDRATALIRANRVTYLAATMTGPLNPQVPVAIALLDYFGRELEIWAAAKNGGAMDKLNETVDSIHRTWEVVRPAVLRRGGSAEARQFSQLIAQLNGARTQAGVGRLAALILDQVDNLERVFQKP